jgi:trehalose 6-phosphate synthase/phosphatase
MNVNRLDVSLETEIVQCYLAASTRILFLDHDGTLVPLERNPDLAIPSREILDMIRLLAGDPKNLVVIISGRQRQFLDHWFGDLCVLVAEHGAFLRAPPGQWVCQVEPDSDWKDQIHPILNHYAKWCPGVFIEVKTLSLAWHYRNAKPDQAKRCLQDLKQELKGLTSLEDRLHFLEGHQVIEIMPRGYNKGATATKLLGTDTFDFILAMGDDRTDEDLFQVLPPEAFTFKIGMSSSVAKYRLKDPAEVWRLLELLGRA